MRYYGAAYSPLTDLTKGAWHVNIYRFLAKRVIVSWQNGYAGPPVKNLEILRGIVNQNSVLRHSAPLSPSLSQDVTKLLCTLSIKTA